MTPVIAGSINRTLTGPHPRCDMFMIIGGIEGLRFKTER